MGLVGTELVSVYISVCAALAVIHRRNHHRKLVKRSPTHLKPIYLKLHPLSPTHLKPHPLRPTNLNSWPSEWLLSHNGARGLVIDVEVAMLFDSALCPCYKQTCCLLGHRGRCH